MLKMLFKSTLYANVAIVWENTMSIKDIHKEIEAPQKKKEEMLGSEKTVQVKQVKQLINDYKISMGSIRNVIYVGFDNKGKGIRADLKNVSEAKNMLKA